MLINFLGRLLLGIALVAFTNSAWAETVTTSSGSNRAFIKITANDLKMNFRNKSNLNQSMGTLGKNSVIQLPDGMAIFDSNGKLNMKETLNNWDHKTKVDPKYKALAPKPCKKGVSYMCVPVRVIKSSSGKIADKTIGYISLDYISKKVSSNRYKTSRVLKNLSATTNEEPANQTTTSGNSETTSTEETQHNSGGGYSSSEIYNCNNTLYRKSNFTARSCLKKLSLKQKAELVMSDVLKINKLRPQFKLDPRMSACMAYRESGFSPNAKGGTPDWGMYQVIDGTARAVLKRNRAVTPGFMGISWADYRPKMLRSTLAQADLHHSVVYLKAKAAGNSALKAMNTSMSNLSGNSVNSEVVRKIARRYNGSGARARRYGKAIQNCFICMKSISSRSGAVTKSGKLSSCLKKAKH